MKILLIGEYSRLHNSLKEGLTALGHEVILVSDTDQFKNYPSDFPVSSEIKKKKWGRLLGKAVYRLTGIDIFAREREKKILKILPELKDFDIIQFINQNPFGLPDQITSEINLQLIKQNKKAFLLACGEDSHTVDYYSRDLMKYSSLTALLEQPELEKEFAYSLNYLSPGCKKNFEDLTRQIQAIIPTDFDYVIPYQNHPLSTDVIPNPVNVDKIKYGPMKMKDKIHIFHGINRSSFYKKGSHIILNVLKEIENKYPDKVIIHLTENLPYKKYIEVYGNSHIFIDQVYSYDQGYNALEAMAAGKCVFTGGETEWLEFYKPEKQVLVNALPDEKKLFKQMESLILNPDKILEIGRNARIFIEKEHHYLKIAKIYLDTWNKA